MSKNKDIDIFSGEYILKVETNDGELKQVTPDELEEMVPQLELVRFTSESTIPINNYFLTFWQPILGPVPSILYFQLTRLNMQHRQPTFTIDEIARCSGVSRTSVKRHLQTLTKFKFLNTVQVFSADTGIQKPNLYLLLKETPMLNKEQYDSLPKELQEEHDEYKAKLGRPYVMTIKNY